MVKIMDKKKKISRTDILRMAQEIRKNVGSAIAILSLEEEITNKNVHRSLHLATKELDEIIKYI